MRLVIFILALAVHDVAVSLGGKEFDDSSMNVVGMMFVIFAVLDIVDFMKRQTSR